MLASILSCLFRLANVHLVWWVRWLLSWQLPPGGISQGTGEAQFYLFSGRDSRGLTKRIMTGRDSGSDNDCGWEQVFGFTEQFLSKKFLKNKTKFCFCSVLISHVISSRGFGLRLICCRWWKLFNTCWRFSDVCSHPERPQRATFSRITTTIYNSSCSGCLTMRTRSWARSGNYMDSTSCCGVVLLCTTLC